MSDLRLPAEWEPQSGVMLTWPHPQQDWAEQVADVERVYLDLAREISRRERVLIVCHDDQHRFAVQQRLAEAGVSHENLRLAIAASNDVWARDHGPVTVYESNKLILLNFIFNGWGGKYSSDLDNQITRKLAEQHIWDKHPVKDIDLVLEGGAIESDGQGNLLVTSSCLLDPSRNPAADQGHMESLLKKYLGAKNVLWLDYGHLEGDDTDGHIDTLARFIDPHTIAYVSCNDPKDVHYDSLRQMETQLRTFRQPGKESYNLIALPLPGAKYDLYDKRLPATYANFLIINQAVLVPTYSDESDQVALDILQACFPEREVIAVDCLPLIQQYGSLHCVTMQLPRGILN